MKWEKYFNKNPLKDLRENVDLSLYSRIKIGGRARYFLETADVETLRSLSQFAFENDLSFHIIGHGTNMCFADAYLEGLFVKINKEDWFQIKNDKEITFPAGMDVMRALQIAQKNSLAGLEFCVGIPGSIGGAVKMNAGTKIGEMKDILDSVCLLDEKGVRNLSGDALSLGYRFSNLRENQIVLSASCFFRKVNDEEMMEEKKKVRAYIKERNERQPIEFPTLGSTFKNPPGHFAAKLLEECGLKGRREGGVGFSEKHANFLINYGGASAEDLKKLVNFARERVFLKTSIFLELEIKTIGIQW